MGWQTALVSLTLLPGRKPANVFRPTTGALRGNTTASQNVAIGVDALRTQSFDNSGAPWNSLNTAVGYQALFSNQPTSTSTGVNDTAVGGNALLNNTTGSGNTASGRRALQSNTTGFNNTANGQLALQTNMDGFSNTATGVQALESNAGSNNTATGVQALQLNTSGLNNTAFGVSALVSNTTGSNNTAVGFQANVGANNLTNATAIGYNATVNASNKIRLGDSNVTVIEGQVAYTFPSDRTKKENFRDVNAQEILEKLRGMSVTSWNYIGHDPKEFRHYGPMAQDFFAAFGHDEVGAIGTDTTINSGDITGILMAGLKGLDAQVQKDQQTISAQAARIADLENQAAEIASLKQQVAGMANMLKTLTQPSVIQAALVTAPQEQP